MRQLLHLAIRKISKHTQKIDKPKLRADFLRNIGATGWGLSCAGQLFAIAINPEVPSKDKKFLMAQELTDGLTNIIMFLALTSHAKKIGENLAVRGHFLPDFMKTHKFPHVNTKGKKLEDAKNLVISKIKDIFPENEVNEKIECFNDFADGVGIVTSLLGSVLAINITAPLVRNKIASWYQAWHINRENTNQVNEQEKLKLRKYETFPNSITRLSNIHIDESKYKFEKPTPLSQRYNFYKTNNNMRV